MTAATCASVASWTMTIGRYAGSRAVAVDDVAHAPSRRRRSPPPARRIVRSRSLVCSRTIEMLKALRFSTSTRPVRSKITPRGARSVSVRWWLFSAISWNLACCTTWKNQKPPASRPNADQHRHPQHGEPGREAPPIFGNGHEASYRYRLSGCAGAPAGRRNPGSHSISWNATTPTNAVAHRLPHHRRVGRRELAQVEQHVQPHEDDGVGHRGRHEHQEPRQGRRDDELCAHDAGQQTPPGSWPGRRCRGCRSTARPAAARPRVPASSPVTGPDDSADVDHHDQHQVERRRAAEHEARQRGLQGQGDDDGRQRGGDLHGVTLGSPPATRRRAHDQHLLEAREVHGRPDRDPWRSAVPVSTLSIVPITNPLG